MKVKREKLGEDRMMWTIEHKVKQIYKWIFICNVPLLFPEKNVSKQMSVEIWLASTGIFVIDDKPRPKGMYI